MKNMYIRIPDDLHAGVKRKALADGISMNHIAVQAISSYLNSVELKLTSDSKQTTLMFNGNDAEEVARLFEQLGGKEEWIIRPHEDG